MWGRRLGLDVVFRSVFFWSCGCGCGYRCIFNLMYLKVVFKVYKDFLFSFFCGVDIVEKEMREGIILFEVFF